MHVDTSILSLISEANVLVQFVMLLLLVASVISWTMIVSKWKTIKEARSQADEFEDQFWSGTNLASLYERVKLKIDPTGMEHIFVSGFREYVRLHQKPEGFPGRHYRYCLAFHESGHVTRGGSPGALSFFSGHRGLDGPLYWFVRYGMGHYERISCPE